MRLLFWFLVMMVFVVGHLESFAGANAQLNTDPDRSAIVSSVPETKEIAAEQSDSSESVPSDDSPAGTQDQDAGDQEPSPESGEGEQGVQADDKDGEEQAGPKEAETRKVPETQNIPQTAPKRPLPAPVPVPQETPEEKLAREELAQEIDTMDLEQPEGNWLLKRHWWEESKKKYKKIRELFEQILQSRMTFFEKRSAAEKTVFNPFHREIGIEQEELRETIDSLLDLIEEEAVNKESLEQEDVDFLKQIMAEKGELAQLKIDIDSIYNIDAAIDDALSALIGKVNEASKFERSAWDEFEAIAQELSDSRARERYYVIANIYDNLKALQGYIQNEFSSYFDGIVQSAKDKTERFKEMVQMLKDKGIDLKEQASRLEDDQEEDEDAKLAAAKTAEQEAARKAAQAAKEAKGGFFSQILSSVIQGLKWFWNFLFGWWLYRM